MGFNFINLVSFLTKFDVTSILKILSGDKLVTDRETGGEYNTLTGVN